MKRQKDIHFAIWIPSDNLSLSFDRRQKKGKLQNNSHLQMAFFLHFQLYFAISSFAITEEIFLAGLYAKKNLNLDNKS